MAELESAIAYAGTKSVLLVVGAGNSGLDVDRAENFTWPACFDLENILTVAMIDFQGGLVSYLAGDSRRGSNYGPRNVDIAALDENFTTDVENGRSAYRLGARNVHAPVLWSPGMAALALSVNPELSALALKRILLDQRHSPARPPRQDRLRRHGQRLSALLAARALRPAPGRARSRS